MCILLFQDLRQTESTTHRAYRMNAETCSFVEGPVSGGYEECFVRLRRIRYTTFYTNFNKMPDRLVLLFSFLNTNATYMARMQKLKAKRKVESASGFELNAFAFDNF